MGKLTDWAFSNSKRAGISMGSPQNPMILWGEEEQGSGRSFRRKAETEVNGLCDDDTQEDAVLLFGVKRRKNSRMRCPAVLPRRAQLRVEPV